MTNLPLNDLVAVAHFPDNKAVGLGIVATGLMYNVEYFKDKGWAPPTSWNDFRRIRRA